MSLRGDPDTIIDAFCFRAIVNFGCSNLDRCDGCSDPDRCGGCFNFLSLSLDCLINGGGGFDCLNGGGGGFDCLISGGGSWVFLSLRFFVLVVFVAFLD